MRSIVPARSLGCGAKVEVRGQGRQGFGPQERFLQRGKQHREQRSVSAAQRSAGGFQPCAADIWKPACCAPRANAASHHFRPHLEQLQPRQLLGVGRVHCSNEAAVEREAARLAVCVEVEARADDGRVLRGRCQWTHIMRSLVRAS